MLAKRIGFGIWALLVLGCFLAARSFFSAVLLMGTIGVTLFSVVSLSKSRQKLTVSLEVPRQIKSGKKKSAKLILKNTGAFPVFSVKGRICCHNQLTQETAEIPFSCGLKPYMEQQIPIKFKSPYCGRVTIELKDLTGYDLAGIFSIKLPATAQGATLVMPLLEQEEPSEMKGADDGKGSQSGEERFGVKEYTEGDPVSHIHWKLSGKLDTLMIRETMKQGGACPGLFLETDLSKKAFAQLPKEAARRASMLLSVSNEMAENGKPHKIVYYCRERKAFREILVETVEELSRCLDELLSVTFFCEDGKGTLARYIEEAGSESYFSMIYITDADTAKLGEWTDEQRIEPLYWTESES